MAFNLQPDFVVFGFSTGVAVATAILFGLGPALRASREKVELSLHGGQRVIGSAWSGRLLLVGQLALSLPLLCRHPAQPQEQRLIHTAITAGTSRVMYGPLCLHAVAITPAGLIETCSLVRFHQLRPSP